MPRTCLIAAHDPWFIQLLRIYSEESGFRVVQAFEGQDVLSSIHQEHPQVILLQGDLPGEVPVLDVLRSVRSDAFAGTIPLLVFSWEGHQPDAETHLGAVAQLAEPVTYDAFVEALKKSGVCLAENPIVGGEKNGSTSRKQGEPSSTAKRLKKDK